MKPLADIFLKQIVQIHKEATVKKKSLLALSILTAVLSFFPSQRVSAYEDTMVIESLQTIEGNVTEIDTENRRVTERWMADEVLMKYQDIILDVPDSCAITKNGETVGLQDLEQNDPASIRFDSNAQPLPRAGSITVTE